jgi:hypothetical protein
LVGLIDNCVTGPGDTPDHVSLYARFDDLRAAAASKDMFESALTTVTFEFVDHHEYFAFDHTHARAQNISAYDGQVEFVATPKTMMDFNLEAIFAEVREFAEQFGPVRSFAYIETKCFQAPRFRAEYFSVKLADSVIADSAGKDVAYFSVSHCFLPPLHLHTPFLCLLESSLTVSEHHDCEHKGVCYTWLQALRSSCRFWYG